jgi:hypothetical protein
VKALPYPLLYKKPPREAPAVMATESQQRQAFSRLRMIRQRLACATGCVALTFGTAFPDGPVLFSLLSVTCVQLVDESIAFKLVDK